MKKFITFTLSFTLAIAMFAIASFASAAYSINTDPQDCRTVTIANHNTGTGTGSPCWTGTTVSAIDGQTINVAIYLHNAGNTPANNVVVKLTDPRNTTFNEDDAITFTGRVFVNGTQVDQGTVTLNLNTNGDSELTLYDVTRYNRVTRRDDSISGGSAIFSSVGLNIGSLGTGWANQTVIKVALTINGDEDTSGDKPYVDTNSPTMYNNDTEVRLSGDFDSNGLETDVYFRYRKENRSTWIYTDEETMDENDSGTFTERLEDLDPGDYEYQACASNDEATRCGRYTSSVSDSGYMKQFTIEDDNGHNCPSGYYWDDGRCVQVQGNNVPAVSTLRAISVGSTVVIVDGYYNSTGCNALPSTSFRYGTTQNLGSQTPVTSRTTYAGAMATSIAGLVPNTTYYYQATATNCAGTGFGSIESFRTGGAGVVNPPVVTVSGGSFIKLTITNNRDTVRKGREIPYDLTWENISNKNLKDLVLEVHFPKQMDITEADKGEITRSGDSVVLNIASLAPREKGEMTIYTEVTSGLRDGDPVVAQAIMAFENPTNQATENAIAYDADEFATDTGGFLRLSFIQWLLVILIILAIIALLRYITRKEKKEDKKDDTKMSGPTQDYIAYRPTPQS